MKALITGASSGIGRDMARYLSSLGYDLVILARRTELLEELKSELKKVVWPSKSQVIKNTLIVIAAAIIIGIVIRVLDLAFGFGISKLIK